MIQFYNDKNSGEMMPGKKGISLNVEQVRATCLLRAGALETRHVEHPLSGHSWGWPDTYSGERSEGPDLKSTRSSTISNRNDSRPGIG
jgi:hypothetical protein